MKKYIKVAALLLVAVSLVGCASKEEPAVTESAGSGIGVIGVPDITEPVIEMPVGFSSGDTVPATEEVVETVPEETKAVASEQKYVMTASSIEGTETSYFYDEAGRLIREESPELGSVVTYTYDNNGKLFSKEENALVHYYTEYDVCGNPDARYQFVTQEGAETKILNVDYEYQYDDQQRPTRIKMGSYSGDGQLISAIEEAYYYSEDGSYSVSTVESWLNNDNEMVAGSPAIKYYNATGSLTRQEIPDAGIEVIYTYDEYGNVLSEETIRSSEGQTTTTQVSYENSYNESGKLTRSIKSEGKLADDAAGEAQIVSTPISQNEYEYDNNGNLVLERFTNLVNGVGYENTYTYEPLN